MNKFTLLRERKQEKITSKTLEQLKKKWEGKDKEWGQSFSGGGGDWNKERQEELNSKKERWRTNVE